MIPKKNQPYFKMTHQTNDGANNLIEGILTCCNSHDFEVLVVGKIKHSVFSKMYLFPENDKTIIEVRCRNCGKVISVFDSSCDGYEQCGKEQYGKEQYGKEQYTHVLTKPICCKKCRNGGFSVGIKYEYPNIQELEELEITQIDNAFTWIWITLGCNNCGTIYKNFVDCETT